MSDVRSNRQSIFVMARFDMNAPPHVRRKQRENSHCNSLFDFISNPLALKPVGCRFVLLASMHCSAFAGRRWAKGLVIHACISILAQSESKFIFIHNINPSNGTCILPFRWFKLLCANKHEFNFPSHCSRCEIEKCASTLTLARSHTHRRWHTIVEERKLKSVIFSIQRLRTAMMMIQLAFTPI